MRVRAQTHALCAGCFAERFPGRVVPALDKPREDVCCLCREPAGAIYVRDSSAIPDLPWVCDGEHN